MKKICVIASLSLFLFACNINPNKEARIQQLETEIQQTKNKINRLESSVLALEAKNEELRTRILELEKQ
jgi:peptidoglycan hydrolase CwlO-like protein